jgi:hypothetical protein
MCHRCPYVVSIYQGLPPTDAGSRLNEVNEFPIIYLILSAALGPGVYSASNINDYQKPKNNVSGKLSAAGA